MRPRDDLTAADGVAGPSNGASGSGAGRVSAATGGRALGGTQSMPILRATVGAPDDSDADDDNEMATSSSLPTTAPRRSPRVHAAALPSSASTIKAGTAMKAESLSPSRAKFRSASILADVKPDISRDPKGKGKGRILLEISDSDEEGGGRRGPVLAPSSVSPATRQRRRAALEKRMTVGKDGRQQLDLTFSSSPEPVTNIGYVDDSETDSDDAVVIVSPRPASRRSSPARSISSRASRASDKGDRTSSLAPPTSPTKGKGKENPRSTSPRLTRLDYVSKAAQAGPAITSPLATSPLAKTPPKTPSKADSDKIIAVNSASRTLRSASKPNSSPVRSPDGIAFSAHLPYSPRLAEKAKALARELAPAAGPGVYVTTATSSSPPRGLLQTANLAILTTPPRARPTLIHRSTNLTALALTSDSTSIVPTSNLSPARSSTPTQRAAFAALLSGTRTPGGGPAYIRDPSGSPLSSAGPTPKKQLSRSSTWPATASGSGARRSSSRTAGSSSVVGSRRKPKNDLVLEPPSSVNKIVDGKTIVVVRKPKPSPARPSWKMRRARKAPTSEWDDGDEEMPFASETEDDDDREDSFATARETSPSPAKARASVPKGKRRGSFPSSDEEGKEDEGDDSASGSSSAGSDSDSDSDADDFAALLARATQRRADGQTLASTATTSPGAPSTSTPPTTVSPAKDAFDDGPRRSARAHHAPKQYSPSRPGDSARTGAVAAAKKAAKADLLGLEKQRAGQKGGLSFDRLVKENLVKQVRGSTAQRYAELMAGSDEEDKNSDSDASSSSDLENPSALSSFRPLDAKIVGRALASSDHGGSDSDDDLPAPTAMKAKGKVDRIEALVREEHEREKGKKMEGESRSELRERTVWRQGVVKVSSLKTVAKSFEGAGWQGVVADMLKGAIVRPSSFPSPVLFFSPLIPHGQGSLAEYPTVCGWLLSLICHPSIPSSLADRLFILLHLILKTAARNYNPTTRSTSLLPASSLLDALCELGAQVHDEKEQESASDDPDSDDSLVASALLGTTKSVVVSMKDQRECASRWCQVVRILSETSPRLLTDGDSVELLSFCIRLSLDPTSACLRSPLSWTISSLLHSMSSSARHNLFTVLSRKYRSTRPQLQYEMLQMLPHDSPDNRNLRKWLAGSLLVSDQEFERLQRPTTLSASVFPSILSALSSPPPGSAFHLSSSSGDTAADIKLFEQAQILLLAVTDFGDEITTAPPKERAETRKILDEIVARLEGLDSKLRTDAKKGLLVERLRAKNLLLSLRHSITFQLRRARGQVGAGFGFSDETAGKEEKAEKKRKRDEEEVEKSISSRGRDGLKQVRLSFGAGTSATSGLTTEAKAENMRETAALPSMQDDEDQDEDLPAPSSS
ncbi:hypothetical protein JCM11251_000468 [Rhodosporidiobolus azoricus]